MAGGNRASKKFSFPLPRRLRDKPEHSNPDTRSIPSVASGPEPPLRHDDSSSKAHRVLGTSDGLYRSTTGQASIPASPGYISITVSDASVGSQFDDRNSVTTENSGGTLRSHYDAKNSPLAISQQTSDSAIRDRALRRGQPPVLTDHGYEIYEPSPVSPMILNEKRKKEGRKSKPVRLDLSKLFPRPRDNDGPNYGGPLLSPNKMVNSPAAMSVNSGYFPRIMSRGSMSQAAPTKLHKTNVRHHDGPMRSQPSPAPSMRRNEHDNAKVNIRRPPRGVQHWFDALDEDSDESPENSQRVPTPKASGPHMSYHGSSAGQLSQTTESMLYASRSQNLSEYKRDSFALEDIVDMTHLTSPSQHSLSTYHSQTSSKTKESVLSKTNLQDSSILSFSSSEDEAEGSRSRAQSGTARQSLESADYSGDVALGQAQAYEVRPHRRRRSAGGMSTYSTSTNAATIEVMYTPEPRLPSHHFSRSNTHSSSKRLSHVRQPSVIHEDEDAHPQTAFETPISPSIQSVTSAHTSNSAPQSYPDSSHKFMQVTAEEEALLELMRKKRAAMNKYCSPPASIQEHDDQQRTRPEASVKQHRTSAFLSMESKESSPVRTVDTKYRQRAASSAATGVATPPQSHARGRSAMINGLRSQFRDSSASDTWSDRHYSPVGRGRLPHYLPPPTEFSPLDPFPQSSPTFATSVTSPNSEGNPSPLPSPITPGPRTGEPDVAVQVASSETSNELYDMTMAENGIVGAPSHSTKSDSSRGFGSHRRRRTASSDTEINFPTPPTSTGFRDMNSVSATSSRAPSIVEPPIPKFSKKKKVPRHISELAIASIETRSRQSSINSTSRSSVHSQTSSHQLSAGKRRSRHLSPDASFTSHPRASEDRDSVSDDIMAAWNSLGGTY
ncbi:hypothetical protein HRS9122_04169 [Pyrenophora teres f. teres]|nr:hypothetical protein HRS9122_04169 [Pyrenophora teres f. teres]